MDESTSDDEEATADEDRRASASATTMGATAAASARRGSPDHPGLVQRVGVDRERVVDAEDLHILARLVGHGRDER